MAAKILVKLATGVELSLEAKQIGVVPETSCLKFRFGRGGTIRFASGPKLDGVMQLTLPTRQIRSMMVG